MSSVLEIKNLTKIYHRTTALDNLSITVEKGQVFGLLGPNGSGKTTTLGILLGVLKQNSGSYSWFGNGSKDENRKNIGSLLETPNFYPYMNAEQNLKVVGKIKDVENLSEAIEKNLKKVGLWQRRKSKFRTFSLGMKQRLALASALLNDPDVLVLDEPTNGLDPQGIAEMRALINAIAKEGKTIILASHLLDEVEKLCSHLAILKEGKLVHTSSLAEFMRQDRLLNVKVKPEDKMSLMKIIDEVFEVNFVKEEEGEIMIAVDERFDAADINKLFAEKGLYLSGLREFRKNLEATFLEMIN